MAIPAKRRGKVKVVELLRVRGPRTDIAVWRAVAKTIVKRIKKGEADWPVDTGASLARFFATDPTHTGFRLKNKMEYAIWVEVNTRLIERFVSRVLTRVLAAELRRRDKKAFSTRLPGVDKSSALRRAATAALAAQRSRRRAAARQRARERYGEA